MENKISCQRNLFNIPDEIVYLNTAYISPLSLKVEGEVIAKMSAFFLGQLPKPLLTQDQLRLLKYDNVASGKYKTNFECSQ